MQIKQALSSLLIVSFLLFQSCKEESGVPAKFYYNYFPVEVGSWVEYDVTHIVLDEVSGVYDTTRYQLQELIESSFIDNQGRPSLRIERYWRDTDTDPWTIKDVWYSTRTSTKAEKIEEDYRYLKLIFPVKENEDWNGNVYNTKDAEEYEYEYVHEPDVFGSLNFDSTAKVLQRFEYNFVEEDEAYEKYATGVGLIEKFDKYFTITYVSGNPNPVAKLKGYSYLQTVTSYGN